MVLLKMVEVSDLSNWLETTLVFRGLLPRQILQLTKIAQLQTFGKGEAIFHQGCVATGLFIVERGRVKVFKVSPNGKEQILNIFYPGENFAEVAALDGKNFPASAIALEPTNLIFFPRQRFLDLLRQDPDIAIKMLVSLAQHSRNLTELVEGLSFKDVPQRLASYLLDLSERTDNDIVNLDLSKNQIAATLGTIPATLSRAFFRLSNEGLISIDGARIELLDRPGLQQLKD